jgi:hypothetical protein
MDLADVYRIFHSTSAQYTFFSAAHETFSKTDHILGHKASFSKYNKNNSRKQANNWKLNNTLLNDQWVIDEKKEEIKGSWKLMKMKTRLTGTYGTQERQS